MNSGADAYKYSDQYANSIFDLINGDQQSVCIGGVWLRKEGRDEIVVLVELDKTWRETHRQKWYDGGEFEISDIVEPSGIRNRLRDKLDS